MHQDFEKIYITYYKRIYAFLYKLCQNKDLTEELTQETFYQAFISFHRYDGSCSLFTWLAAVAKNTHYRYLKKTLKHKTSNLEFYMDEPSDNENEQPEKAVEEKTKTCTVRSAICTLSPKYRDVVTLRIYADLPFAEIAKYLEISESSAKVLFFRAKKQLREVLKNENVL